MTVSNSLTRQSQLLYLVEPVLELMNAGVLKQALLEAFRSQEPALVDIEEAFHALTARRHDAQALRRFFASWSKTNNSAASVSGLANRITLLARSAEEGAQVQRLHHKVQQSAADHGRGPWGAGQYPAFGAVLQHGHAAVWR